ncbi:MAG: Npt1/Npt2 family nucleotide transporter [Chlamydiota bacterium]
MNKTSQKPFGKFRAFLLPIHSHECKKFVPMFLIFFLIAFIYNLLRASKDTLIVTAASSGAEAIPFIKVWFMLPMAFLMTYVFTRISNRFSKERSFYLMVSIFLGFFFLFTFVLFPNRDHLHPHTFADTVQSYLPLGCKGFVAIFRNWIFSLFYVMSELWSAIIFTVVFWGFANEVTSMREAKRFYGLFSLGANISGIVAGKVILVLSNNLFFPSLPYGTTPWEQYIFFLNATILIAGLAVIALFRVLYKRTLAFEKVSPTKKQPKMKMSLRNNFRYLLKSRYLLSIALIVLAYNVSINLVEVVWKNQVKQLYPDPSDFTYFMGQVMICMGLLATCTSFFITGFCLRRFSWTTNAVIAPLVMLITGGAFFFVLLCDYYGFSFSQALLGSSSLLLSVILGTVQNCFARASKYTLFDATKELAFVPLSKESKWRGKASIDGVGSRLGKSGGSLLYQVLLMGFVTVSATIPIVALLFFGVIGVWITSVVSLGKKFSLLSSEEEKEETIRDAAPIPAKPAMEKPI